MPPKAPALKPLIRARQIERRLAELARDIPRRIPLRQRPVAVVVLQGAFVFAADLLRRLPAEYALDVAFVRCQSYGHATVSSGTVKLVQDIEPDVSLRGRTVLLIDDILDSGLTIDFLAAHLRTREAARVRTCVLLERAARNAHSGVRPDFAGFAIGPEFVVGYGLDYKGFYRNLPDVWTLAEHNGARCDNAPATAKIRPRRTAP